MHKCRSRWADATACHLAQSLQNGGNAKLRILPNAVPRKADKFDFDCDTFPRLPQFEAHGLVEDPEVARKERQRFAEVFRPRRDIEEDPSVAGVGLLGEMKSESAVGKRISRVVEQLRLSLSSGPPPPALKSCSESPARCSSGAAITPRFRSAAITCLAANPVTVGSAGPVAWPVMPNASL
jgi:hypothetical protein